MQLTFSGSSGRYNTTLTDRRGGEWVEKYDFCLILLDTVLAGIPCTVYVDVVQFWPSFSVMQWYASESVVQCDRESISRAGLYTVIEHITCPRMDMNFICAHS